MNNLELKSNSLVHMDFSRRKFVTKLLGGAAVAAPVIAALTASANKAKADVNIYIPNLYTASLFDPLTKVSGVATFEILGNADNTTITYTLSLSNSHAKASDGVLLREGIAFANLPWGTPASVNGFNGVTYSEVLEDLADLVEHPHAITVSIPVTLHGVTGVLFGQLLTATNAQPILVLI